MPGSSAVTENGRVWFVLLFFFVPFPHPAKWQCYVLLHNTFVMQSPSNEQTNHILLTVTLTGVACFLQGLARLINWNFFSVNVMNSV